VYERPWVNLRKSSDADFHNAPDDYRGSLLHWLSCPFAKSQQHVDPRLRSQFVDRGVASAIIYRALAFKKMAPWQSPLHWR
jgi:hypothetical protein